MGLDWKNMLRRAGLLMLFSLHSIGWSRLRRLSACKFLRADGRAQAKGAVIVGSQS
jgi:hypothetical protein